MELPSRKNTRLKKYDYSQNGAYFVTICTYSRTNLLGEVVGCGVLDAPKTELSECGVVCEKHILQINNSYPCINISKFVIMPNHIHMIVEICQEENLLFNNVSNTQAIGTSRACIV